MSEYQYYEFVAVDRPLSDEQVQALRALSTRARITSMRFINHYDWGNFRGNPRALVEECFDLFVYVANWGTRCFMMRLPRVDSSAKCNGSSKADFDVSACPEGMRSIKL